MKKLTHIVAGAQTQSKQLSLQGYSPQANSVGIQPSH